LSKIIKINYSDKDNNQFKTEQLEKKMFILFNFLWKRDWYS